MTFANIPTDTRVFVDANILSYYFLRVMPLFELCDPLFRRAARREITLILAAMSRSKIANLATNDQDFRHVPGIRLWMPKRDNQNAST
jgi:predicted nucleic acid-binding protein